MKKLFILLIILGTCSCVKTSKQSVTLSPDDLMIVYEHGYLMGIKNELTCKSREESDKQWKKDSVEMFELFFKK